MLVQLELLCSSVFIFHGLALAVLKCSEEWSSLFSTHWSHLSLSTSILSPHVIDLKICALHLPFFIWSCVLFLHTCAVSLCPPCRMCCILHISPHMRLPLLYHAPPALERVSCQCHKTTAEQKIPEKRGQKGQTCGDRLKEWGKKALGKAGRFLSHKVSRGRKAHAMSLRLNSKKQTTDGDP